MRTATIEIPTADGVADALKAELYAGAAHGYTMSDTAAWNEPACERHFAGLFALLGRALPAAG